MYYKRLIDKQLLQWKKSRRRQPLLLRGARQVGKSSAVRELGKHFQYFAEVNLEKMPALRQLFSENINVHSTCEKISGTLGVPIIPGKTLLFIDEIQLCKEAIMSLRYFKEDFPELHVIAAGSLLEFVMEELPSFGVGRIRSMYMYPFSFDEFLLAQGLERKVEYKNCCSTESPLSDLSHQEMVDQLRSYFLVGGMPAAVSTWVETRNYLETTRIHHDILDTYQDDFAKYKKRVSPTLLHQVLRSVAVQAGSKFIYAHVGNDTTSILVKDALHLLTLAGLIAPVTHSDGTGIPLGACENQNYRKYLFFDIGIMLTLLGTPASDILLASNTDLVNKGAIAEMFVGLELQKYQDCFVKSELFYWQNTSRNGNAEVDYLLQKENKIVPLEVKANTRGSMQSLWVFMQKRNSSNAIRTSLENFGSFNYNDLEKDQVRCVKIIPLYALHSLF